MRNDAYRRMIKKVGIMKFFLKSTEWKTDPRAAYIPPAFIAIVFACALAISMPAWSFETYHAHINEFIVEPSAQPQSVSAHKNERKAFKKASPVQMDNCTPLLSSSYPAHMDRTQRSAGKAAAIGLVFGVRFALTPPKKAKAGVTISQPQLDVWQPKAALGSDRSALAVAAYRECQKSHALQALNDYRWQR